MKMLLLLLLRMTMMMMVLPSRYHSVVSSSLVDHVIVDLIPFHPAQPACWHPALTHLRHHPDDNHMIKYMHYKLHHTSSIVICPKPGLVTLSPFLPNLAQSRFDLDELLYFIEHVFLKLNKRTLDGDLIRNCKLQKEIFHFLMTVSICLHIKEKIYNLDVTIHSCCISTTQMYQYQQNQKSMLLSHTLHVLVLRRNKIEVGGLRGSVYFSISSSKLLLINSLLNVAPPWY